MSNFTFKHGGEEYSIASKSDLKDIPNMSLVALYNKLTGKETKKFASREKGEAQVWRELERQQATAAVKAPQEPKAKKAPAAKATPKVRQPRFVFKKDKEIKPPRETTKRHTVLTMLRRQNGATLAEIEQKVWPGDRKTTYEAVRLLHFQHGFGLRQDEAGRIYVEE